MSTQGPVLPSHDLSDAKRRLLAQRLKGASASQREAERIRPRTTGSKTPISADQYRIWLHATMQPETPTYNEPVTLRYRGPLDVALLEASLNRFLTRHEAWRTSFAVQQDEVVQIVHPEVRVDLTIVDLTHLPEGEREHEARRLAILQAAIPVALDQVPLLRTTLTRIAPDDHRLDMVVHHVIFDWLSIQRTFLPELAAIYASLAHGSEFSLPAPELQYPDYAAWRREQIESPAMARHLDLWRKRLSGELPILRLPADRSRPATPTQRGSVERFTLPRELTESLRRIGQAHGMSLYMTMLAVFKVLLFRYSGQEDVIVGGIADARRRPELQGMMGYLLDTLVVRTAPTAKLPFSTYLDQVRKSVLEALEISDVPFERVVQAVCAKRDLSHHPIFQTFFSFLPPAERFPAGWEIPSIDVTVSATKFDIYLEVDERPTHTAGRIIYSTDLFDAETIRRMAGHWRVLLEAVTADPDTALGDLQLLTDEERELMLVRWNDQASPIPATTVHSLVEQQVRLTPDRPAVQFGETTLTYAQLDRRAEMLAAHLRLAGAAPGRLVALCIDRSENLPASLIAILKTGAAYLPLDPDTPRARILLCLEDAAPAVLLTQRSLAHDLPADGAAVLILEDLLQAGDPSAAHPTQTSGPSDAAYIIHTSGSTGRPKAVELRHESVVNLLLSMQRQPGFTASDVLLAVTTISFDIAVLEMFLPLISGGRVLIASRSVAIDPGQIAAMLESHGCTVLQATPATWRALVANDWRGKPGLRVFSGGEALTRDLADALLALGLEVWNLYGPTETTIWSTARRVRPGTGPVAIGRPIANTTAYILDANEQPVPVGVPGELYLGGLGVANGYRGQPELTAQKFVTPAVANGERVYRTGDNAVYRADGAIECQGRADNQVKVRGYRIELEDVEFHLDAHPAVSSAAARIWPDPTGGNRLSAYVVGKNGPPPDASELRAFLQDLLPQYMIPSDIIALDAMPLTSNGKKDRKALPQPDPAVSRAAAALPVTEEEIKLAKIWSEVLGVASVGRDDNFFDLGGHSLLLVRLFARINREFAANLPITTIFDTRTMSALATLLRDKQHISPLVPVQTSGAKTPLFMAYSYLLYHPLSSALGEEQPFYGLRELEEDGSEALDQRALRYIGDMRRIQQRGPYRVGGWCAAAPMAVEIARQLLLAGEEVSLVVLFDAWLPGYAEELLAKESSATVLKDKIAHHRSKLQELSLGGRVRYGWGKVVRIGKMARDNFYFKHWTLMNRLSKRFNFALPQFMHNASLQTISALQAFNKESLPVRITLIRASDSPHVTGASNFCGWEQVAEHGVEVLWAPGDHETMFLGDNLKVTAGLVDQGLAGMQLEAELAAVSA